MTNTKKNTKIEQAPSKQVAFAAIDQYVVSNILSPTEKKTIGYKFVLWGDRNAWPQYIHNLYKIVPTVKSVINGSVDYVLGNNIKCNVSKFEDSVNKRGETWNDLIENIARDYYIYGGFAINVIRDKSGNVNGLYYLNMMNIRTDKDNNEFYYSDDWSKSYGRVKYTVYPKFNKDSRDASSVFYYKNDYNQTYPASIWEGSVKAAEIEKCIDEYHLNNVKNNFSGNYIVNFNNGQPSDAQKEEIESNFNEKYTGAENSGRVILSWNDSKDNETTIAKIESEDFGAKYDSLAKRVRQSIFTSFRATPNLFGIPTETTGFNSQEYEEAFKLYNRTQIRPLQIKIVDAIDKILGVKGSIEIAPFILNNDTEQIVK